MPKCNILYITKQAFNIVLFSLGKRNWDVKRNGLPVHKHGDKQFLKDFRRERDVQKTAAHCLNILTKNKKMQRPDAKINMEEMQADRTQGRVTSHKRLEAIVAQFGDSVLASSYKKSELLMLCNAHGVPFTRAMKKDEIRKLLAVAISKFTSMPFPINLAEHLRSETVVSRLGQPGNAIKIRIFSAAAHS